MKNRVNKIRVWYKYYCDLGVYNGTEHKSFFLPASAAGFIRKSLQKPGPNAPIGKMGDYFERVEVGNDSGWVPYEVNPNLDLDRLIESLTNAKEMHLSFYDDGESAKEYVS
jgi:hypothetical protein